MKREHFTLPYDGGLIEKDLPKGILHSYEKVWTYIYDDARPASDVIADRIIAGIKECQGRLFRLGLTTGSTPISLYNELARRHKAGEVSFRNVEVVSIDEYYPSTREERQSRNYQLHEALLDKVDILEENIHIPDGSVPQDKVSEYNASFDQIARGLDLLVIGIGEQGQVGFNEAGTTAKSRTRTVRLSHPSRKRQSRFFLGDMSATPTMALTIGISTMLSAKEIILMAWGEDKASVVKAVVEGNPTTACPASLLQQHEHISFYVDQNAAAQLTRVVAPWLIGPCDWSRKFIRAAVVWLCQKVHKPILKLTEKDYLDNSLDELIEKFGPYDKINIEVFNDLQHTITGWPGGKPNADDTYRPERMTPYPKRVLVFSPHPDDAIVSMGGTVQRLIQQGHDVRIAIQTDGDLAVSDDDLMRSVMLAERLTNHFEGRVFKFIDETLDKLIGGTTTDDDRDNIRYFKGSILLSEAMIAYRQMGVSRENLYDLRMPFYVNDPHGQGKLTDADVAVIEELINQVKPHQIFLDNDLVDPYGTHARAAGAILHALNNLKDKDYMRDCRVWMYRGQWGQWDVDHVEMAVPMSPEEFGVKRDAILKFHSQIHDAPFRSSADGQLPWQRSIERNRDLAEKYQQLGLATYEAIEAFVQYRFMDND